MPKEQNTKTSTY